MPPLSPGLARFFRPPVRPTPQQQSGPSLAMPVANPGARGQNMRYYLGNLTRLDDGSYTDGVYRYDSNGLSLDRPDSPVSGLPPADWGGSWDVWRAPNLGSSAAGSSAAAGAGVPSLAGFSSALQGIPSLLSGGFGPAQSAAFAPADLVARLASLVPNAQAPLGVVRGESPEDLLPAQSIAYEGSPDLRELLQVAMNRPTGVQAHRYVTGAYDEPLPPYRGGYAGTGTQREREAVARRAGEIFRKAIQSANRRRRRGRMGGV